MPWSIHTIIVPDYPNPGAYLLYHTRTQALIKIWQDLKEAAEHLEDRAWAEPARLWDAELKRLREMGFLVCDRREDEEKLQSFLHQLKYGVDRFLGVQILTTYACNFDCVYCFQQKSRAMEHMTPAIQEQTIAWIQRRMTRLSYPRLHLNFYGGEPLLNPEAVANISPRLQAWCAERDVKFGFSLQTNGYFLTPSLVQRYKTWGLTSVRVSVDGIKAAHDRNRPLKGGQGTFERVMENITAVADLIPVHIACTYENGDVDPALALLDYLDAEGLLSRLGKFLCAPSHAVLGKKGAASAVGRSQCQCHHTDETFAAATRRLNAALEAKGVASGSRLSLTACPLTRENSGVTIDQKGRLYRCNSLLGHPEYALGDVFHDTFNETQKEFRDLDAWRHCPQDCVYLPLCVGGCRLMSFLEKQDFHAPSCRKMYLDRLAPDMIKKEYERLVTPQR